MLSNYKKTVFWDYYNFREDSYLRYLILNYVIHQINLFFFQISACRLVFAATLATYLFTLYYFFDDSINVLLMGKTLSMNIIQIIFFSFILDTDNVYTNYQFSGPVH